MNRDELRFLNPWTEVEVTRNRLPHWQQKGAVYFVTWRLADSIPREKLEKYHQEREEWLVRHPEPWSAVEEAEYHRVFSTRVDRWLDQGHGFCLLRDLEIAEMVGKPLLHFEGKRSVMLSFVIMPNHVHLLFALHPEWLLEKLIHSWKVHSAREINQRKGRKGRLWQKDYFDRLVRDADHFANCVRYIRNNPRKARLGNGKFLLYESELSLQIE